MYVELELLWLAGIACFMLGCWITVLLQDTTSTEIIFDIYHGMEVPREELEKHLKKEGML